MPQKNQAVSALIETLETRAMLSVTVGNIDPSVFHPIDDITIWLDDGGDDSGAGTIDDDGDAGDGSEDPSDDAGTIDDGGTVDGGGGDDTGNDDNSDDSDTGDDNSGDGGEDDGAVIVTVDDGEMDPVIYYAMGGSGKPTVSTGSARHVRHARHARHVAHARHVRQLHRAASAHVGKFAASEAAAKWFRF